MSKQTKHVEVKLPGLFSPAEVLEAFRNAASFQENDARRWEFHSVDATKYENLRNMEGLVFLFARPLFYERPSGYGRVLGRKGKWVIQEQCGRISGSKTAICLMAYNWNWSFSTTSPELLNKVYLAVQHTVDTKQGSTDVYDAADPQFASYRGAYDRIRANFLTTLIELTHREPATQERRRAEMKAAEKAA